MALSKIDAANFLTGTIPQGNVANASLGAVTSLPGAIATGKILQVVQSSSTTQSTTTSTTYQNSNLSAAITPSSSSNKVLIMISQMLNTFSGSGSSGDEYGTMKWKLLRDSTDIYVPANGSNGNGIFFYNYDGAGQQMSTLSNLQYLDSPSTTSAITYKTQLAAGANGDTTVVAQWENNIGFITLLEVAG